MFCYSHFSILVWILMKYFKPSFKLIIFLNFAVNTKACGVAALQLTLINMEWAIFIRNRISLNHCNIATNRSFLVTAFYFIYKLKPANHTIHNVLCAMCTMHIHAQRWEKSDAAWNEVLMCDSVYVCISIFFIHC